MLFLNNPLLCLNHPGSIHKQFELHSFQILVYCKIQLQAPALQFVLYKKMTPVTIDKTNLNHQLVTVPSHKKRLPELDNKRLASHSTVLPINPSLLNILLSYDQNKIQEDLLQLHP